MTESISSLIGPLNGFELVVATGQAGINFVRILEWKISNIFFGFFEIFLGCKIPWKVTELSVFEHLPHKISTVRVQNRLRKLFLFASGRFSRGGRFPFWTVHFWTIKKFSHFGIPVWLGKVHLNALESILKMLILFQMKF